MKRKYEVNKHHIIPTSRGGSNEDNIVLLDSAWHTNYHRLFANLTPKEACKLITWIHEPNQVRSHQQINNKIDELRKGR